MKWLFLMLFCLAIIADIYLYRVVVRPRFRRLSARVAYILFAIATDGAALTAPLLYGAAGQSGTAGVIAVMWLLWIFFLALVPKVFCLAGGILDFLVRLVFRRRTVAFRVLGLVSALAVMVVMVCGATLGRTRLRIEEVEICSDRVPAAFDGYRIAQFSDLHIGTMCNPKKRLTGLVSSIRGLEADMVVNTGDIVNITGRELTAELMDILSRISAPDGVWSVWGNHDLGFYINKRSGLTPAENLADLSEKIGGLGWNTLSDRSTWIRRGADSILLSGLDYPRDPMLNGHNESLAGVDISQVFAGVEGSPFNVVLSHTPKMWDEITSRDRGDLTLSGHIHAMQTKVRFPGGTWSPAQYMYDRWSGKYIRETGGKNRVLYVNDGIGCVGYPMRIGARGEITVITLKRCE